MNKQGLKTSSCECASWRDWLTDWLTNRCRSFSCLFATKKLKHRKISLSADLPQWQSWCCCPPWRGCLPQWRGRCRGRWSPSPLRSGRACWTSCPTPRSSVVSLISTKGRWIISFFKRLWMVKRSIEHWRSSGVSKELSWKVLNKDN